MVIRDKKIEPYNYLSGTEFTKRLKDLTDCRDFAELSSLLGVPKGTFSTWNTHNRTSHELIVRLHLALGIPVEKLALGEQALSDFHKERHGIPNTQSHVSDVIAPYVSDVESPTIDARIPSFSLKYGLFKNTGATSYASSLLEHFGLNKPNVIEVLEGEIVYLIDEDDTRVTSGTYVYCMDDVYYIAEIRRLPGKKLIVGTGELSFEANEDDIKVYGRVAMEMKKK